MRSASLRRLTEGNADLARSLYQHRKILVAALNGPAIGLSAGILGVSLDVPLLDDGNSNSRSFLPAQWFDFIYAVESAYILTPFSTLSLVAEGGASITFPRRMGIAKANECVPVLVPRSPTDARIRAEPSSWVSDSELKNSPRQDS